MAVGSAGQASFTTAPNSSSSHRSEPATRERRPTSTTRSMRSVVDGGAATLAEVTTQVLPLYPEAERFAVADRVAARRAVAAVGAVRVR